MAEQRMYSRRTLLRWGVVASGVVLTSGLLSACGSAKGQDGVALEIACDGDNIAFDKLSLAARTGQQVRLTFHNVSTMHQHNWVLVNGGDEIAEGVCAEGIAAGARSSYVPANDNRVLAHTQLVSSGESETIVFQAPNEPGSYTYVCSFPGHFNLGMKGILVVTS